MSCACNSTSTRTLQIGTQQCKYHCAVTDIILIMTGKKVVTTEMTPDRVSERKVHVVQIPHEVR